MNFAACSSKPKGAPDSDSELEQGGIGDHSQAVPLEDVPPATETPWASGGKRQPTGPHFDTAATQEEVIVWSWTPPRIEPYTGWFRGSLVQQWTGQGRGQGQNQGQMHEGEGRAESRGRRVDAEAVPELLPCSSKSGRLWEAPSSHELVCIYIYIYIYIYVYGALIYSAVYVGCALFLWDDVWIMCADYVRFVCFIMCGLCVGFF